MKIDLKSDVIRQIFALCMSMKLLECVAYGDDEKAMALHDTVMSALDDIENAYRKEKENDKQTNSERI